MSDTYKYSKTKVFKIGASASDVMEFVSRSLTQNLSGSLTEKTLITIVVVEGNNYPEIEIKPKTKIPSNP